LLTFSLSQEDGLLASMMRALIVESHPGACFVAPRFADERLGKALDVHCAETGRWLRLINERPPSEHVWSAIAGGCSAVLTLDSSNQDFMHALGAVTGGGPVFVAPDVLRWIADRATNLRQDAGEAAVADSFVRLTDRESEVLQLVAEGLSNAGIARRLDISPNTVRTHLHALAVKLDGSSRTKILANARALGIPEAGGRPGMRRISESLTA
jgi:DNA-binding CsgD family transcriptional regulator